MLSKALTAIGYYFYHTTCQPNVYETLLIRKKYQRCVGQNLIKIIIATKEDQGGMADGLTPKPD
jgi:hypothetical protein